MTSLPHASELPESQAHSLSSVSYEAYRILQFAFVVAPIIAGLDKFFNMLTNWEGYLAPWVPNLVHLAPTQIMMIVGVVEILAGILVAIKPRIFAWVVVGWLFCIIINLLSMRMFFDIALRDLGLAISAIALARLAVLFDHGVMGGLMTRREREAL